MYTLSKVIEENPDIEYKLIEVMESRLCIFYNGKIYRWLKSPLPHLLNKTFTNDLGMWRLVNDNEKQKGIKIKNKMISKAAIIASAFLNYNIESLDKYIIHLDGNKNNNHVVNLRVVNNKQLLWNQKAKGCSLRQDGKLWEARIKIKGKQLNLGYFKTEDEAHNAYIAAKNKHYNLEN